LADAKSGVTNFMSWTDERIERLKAMWTNGSTASQIAEELGGVSRNAVIGKAHRLGLESRPSPVKPGEEKEKKAKAAVAPKADKPKPAAKAVPAAPASQTIPSVAPADSPREAEAPAAVVTPAGLRPATKKTDPANMQYRSVGPGGFIRQGPGDTQAPIPPPPPPPPGNPQTHVAGGGHNRPGENQNTK
jgi:GcrA cell cycle regulator